jgi:FlaA1/EpsC-like NDP-sugar epimerase
VHPEGAHVPAEAVLREEDRRAHAERWPAEAHKTNILGTLNVRKVCVRNGVERAILVSTDKAVKPVNV